MKKRVSAAEYENLYRRMYSENRAHLLQVVGRGFNSNGAYVDYQIKSEITIQLSIMSAYAKNVQTQKRRLS